MGDNESGKTSIVKAFGVCALHMDSRYQSNYIRDGSKGFGVAIELEDGTTIARLKTNDLNQYFVNYPNGEKYKTTKIDSGLPVQVKEVMGLIEEPETKEPLQIRTYEEQLLFVVTPSSTNYKVMYDALKVDQITRAIKVGSDEVNTLRYNIDIKDTSVIALMENLRDIRTFDIEPVQNIRTFINNNLDNLKKSRKLYKLYLKSKETRDKLSRAQEVDSCTPIDESVVYKIMRSGEVINNITKIKKRILALNESDSLKELNAEFPNRLREGSLLVDSLNKKQEQLQYLQDLDKLKEQDTVLLNLMSGLINKINEVNKLEQEYKNSKVPDLDNVNQSEIDTINKLYSLGVKVNMRLKYEQARKEIEKEIEELERWLKERVPEGQKIWECPKCGEISFV